MKKTKPLVSVVMPVWNREKYVAGAIESILSQTFSDFEFIIVDDGSTDGTRAIIEGYAAKDKRIRLLRHEKNLGVSWARNTGLAEAKGAYLANMDSDDVSLRERLEKQVAVLNDDKSIGGVGVGAHEFTDDVEFLRAHDALINSSFIAFNMVTRGPELIKATAMKRREYYEAAGGYRPELKVIEDVEFYTRLLWKHGIKYTNVPEVLYLIRIHEEHLSKKSFELRNESVVRPQRNAIDVFTGQISDAIYESIDCLHPSDYPTWVKLSYRQRRRSRRNMYRLIEGMIEHGAIDAADREALREEVDKRIEKTTPRWCQQFVHWRRKWLSR